MWRLPQGIRSCSLSGFSHATGAIEGMQYKEVFRWSAFICCALALAACGGGGGGGSIAGPTQSGGNDQGPISITITSPASADEMETPDGSVILAGTASGSNGIVSVTWVSNRGGSGEASGTNDWKTGGIELLPGENKITITAEDDSGATASRTVRIHRESAGTGSVTLEWTAPTHREDGTPLTNLAGFYIHYGRMSGIYDYRTDVDNPGITTYVVEGLKPGKWYFVISAYDTDGIESNFSNEVARIVK